MRLRYNKLMATDTQIASIRRLTAEAVGYTDEQLSVMIDSGMTEDQMAYRIWNEIAASTAQLVNVSESGSTRALSDLHKNALTMANSFRSPVTLNADITIKRTRRAVRG